MWSKLQVVWVHPVRMSAFIALASSFIFLLNVGLCFDNPTMTLSVTYAWAHGGRDFFFFFFYFYFYYLCFFFHLPIKRIWSMDRSACLRRDVFRDDFNFLRSSPLWKLARTTGWYSDSTLHMSKYWTDPRRGRLESHMFPRGVHGTWELVEIWHSNVVGPSKSFLNGNIYIFFGSTAPVSWGWSPKRARHQWAVCWVPIHYRLRHRGFARISPVNSRFIQSYPKLDLFMAAYWTFS